MRVFVASFIRDEKIKEIAKNLQNQFSKFLYAKNVEIENLHITYTFLGEKSFSEVKTIEEKLKECLKNEKAIIASISKILLIPNENFIRVIALEIKSLEAENLRKKIVSFVGGDSHSLHLTLARVKSFIDKQRFLDFIKTLIFEQVYFKINTICLVESLLTPNGPIYKIISAFNLKD